jgi:DDE superfamily endonuclease
VHFPVISRYCALLEVMTNSWSCYDEDEILAVALAAQYILGKRSRVSKHDSVLTGHEYYRELMSTDNESRFRDVTRMDKETFRRLVQLLVDDGGLATSRGTCWLKDMSISISPGEKTMIFIYVLCGHCNRNTQERWQHSGATISRIIHEVASSILKCKDTFITQASANDQLHGRIRDDRKFREFSGCLGALDGVHIPAVVKQELIESFRNRKKFVSQNVLGVCDFDMLFTYCLAGWEGSAHDGRVFADAAVKGLSLPPGRYYLGDAGYALSTHVLTPYRGVRYHLKEWSRHGDRPQNKEELFNLRHSSLRNVIERTFGVIKKRFPILTKMNSFPFPFQVDLVRCAFMLHNFIRREQGHLDIFDEVSDEDTEDQNPAGNVANLPMQQDNAGLKAWRDGIAQRMWEDYLSVLASRDVNGSV